MPHKSSDVTCNLVYSAVGAASLKIAGASRNLESFSTGNTCYPYEHAGGFHCEKKSVGVIVKFSKKYERDICKTNRNW